MAAQIQPLDALDACLMRLRLSTVSSAPAVAAADPAPPTSPLYTASVPVFQHYLLQIAALLTLISEQSTEDEQSELLAARLAEDMMPAGRQLATAMDCAVQAAYPLAGLPVITAKRAIQ